MVTTLTERLGDSMAHWAIRDLFAVRTVLESYAAGEAARHGTAQHVGEIAAAAAAVERKIGQGKSYFRENQAFHMSIARGAQNGVLFFCLKSIIGGLRDLREQMVRRMPEYPKRDVSEHRAILAAISRHDAKSAARLMSHHLRSQIRLLPVHRQTVPENDVGVIRRVAKS
jgi:GntR family transcriptional repressor for pyruvate dehydrogenase complex